MRLFGLPVRFALAAAAMSVSSSVLALCSGFTDVDAASAQCPNVDWLRNREVTLGCTSATLFCPADPVIRLQMAAFMNRLGNALTPNVIYQEGGDASLALGSSPTVCATAEAAAAAYPRTANVDATLTTSAAGPLGASMRIVYSSNGGTTWTFATQAPQLLAGPPGWINGAANKADIPLAPGTPYRFGLRLEAQPGTTQLGPWSCQVKSLIASRTGSGVPY